MKKPFLALLAVLTLTACNTATKPTTENYLATLNAYLPDHPDCLLDGSIRFPYETSKPEEIRQMDALVKAQVLDVTHEPAIHISRYTLTPTGQRATARLCYGHREATSIISSTPPATANGFTETDVVYKYKLMDKPVWSESPDIMAAFPRFAEEASGNATAKITLALTRVGWSVPN